MIIDITPCFKAKFEKIIFGAGETAAKGATNESLNITSINIGKDGQHFVESGGYPAAQYVAMEVNPPTESLNFPIFKSGKDKAIKEFAEEFGNEIGDILFKNSLGSGRAINVLEGCAEESVTE